METNRYSFNKPDTSKYVVVLFATIALLTVSFYLSSEASARPTGVTSISPGTDDFGPPTAAASSDPARGGVITQIDLTATVQTNNWQGYFGYVAATIVLSDSGASQMYSWNVTAPSGSVLASRTSTINVTGLSAQATCTVEDSIIGDAVTDKVSATFTAGAHSNITLGNLTVDQYTNTCTTDLMVDNTTNTTWEENLLKDGGGYYVYQAFIQNYGNEIFNDGNGAFQMMVPEDEAGAAGTTNYFFWVEIR